MITFEELKERTTPEILKEMCKLAEGFEFIFATTNGIIGFGIINKNKWYSVDNETFVFLLYRAVEGWNKSKHTVERIDDYSIRINEQRLFYMYNEYATPYDYANYQPESLTHAECAMLHCLLDRFEEVKK